MTGPEHYREAEKWAELSRQSYAHGPDEVPFAAWQQGQAQVHATLALAAATALSEAGQGSGHDWFSWLNVAGPKP